MEVNLRQRLRTLKSLAGPFPSFDPDAGPKEPDARLVLWLQDARNHLSSLCLYPTWCLMGSVANFCKGRRKGYRWTHLCGERSELLECGLATGWKLPLADHVSHLDAIQCNFFHDLCGCHVIGANPAQAGLVLEKLVEGQCDFAA